MKKAIFILLASAGIALASCSSDRKNGSDGDTAMNDTTAVDQTGTENTGTTGGMDTAATDTSQMKRDSVPGDTGSKK